MFRFPAPTRRRSPSLTPMIDVVFLLLVFFMLASRFGTDMHIPLQMAGQGASAPYSGPPRLVDVTPDTLRVNGVPMEDASALAEVERLTSNPQDTIILRARDGADIQAIVRVMQLLSGAGFTNLVLIE
ncbi:biopolymer transporter ExbD [Donghicola sp. C2-DW-16]|uniref:Biopolymer transporter ExbD n=1 Tax=Donghicola mangrovi TaxID=2729614 RepID=A0ABX2PEN5_9RHOB|nr:biopolymer transporter ExbD [Donghicola mangrovi]NVO27956.1 biopolymer transporter ExbD [Donghicola mangrovi]